jgi:rhodanese-related sulfurtransferase/CBS domain-containing protein
MPSGVTRDQVQELTGRGAQLVEVLPAEEYQWGHLPGAVNVPLKQLGEGPVPLDRSRPVIVYCNDTLCDLSPRAACRLEATGFGPVYDYTAGKTDWLAADLPYEGTAELASRFVRRDVVSTGETTPAGQVREQVAAQGFGPAVVVNAAGVVMGAAYRDSLAAAADGTPVGQVMRFGVGTVRPSEDAAALAHRMGHADLSRIIVTRSDGTLVGLFFTSDAPAETDG